jgi:glycosyltransferase involved in cell wall biosynthesis
VTGPTASGAASRILLWAQAHRPPLPPGLARRVRSVSARMAGDPAAVPLEPWTAPMSRPAGQAVVVPGAVPAAPDPAAPVTRPSAGPPTVRCLLLTDVLDTGGLDEFVAFLARRLPREGFAVVVAKTGVPDGRLAAVLRDEGLDVRETRSAADLDEFLAWWRPDVVSAHAPPAWALPVARRAGVPVVETLHGLPTPVGTDWRAEAARSRDVARFVAVSDLVRRQYLRGNPGYPAEEVEVVPNGFNDSHRPPVDRAAARAWLGVGDDYLFVCLARLTVQKNTFGLVRAFARVAQRRPACRLLVAGRVDDVLYARQVLRLRAGLPGEVARRIHLRDNTPHVSAVLGAADCYVSDSFFEGWSLSTMEAMVAGVPVVTSDVGGAREQLDGDTRRGWLVPNALGDAERATWEAAGRARFGDQPNQDALVEAMLAAVDGRAAQEAARSELARTARSRFDARACLAGHAAGLRLVAGRSASVDR